MLGAFRTVSALAAPGQRAGLIAAYFIASYLAFSIPVVAAGVATTHVGLHRTALVYGAALAVLAALAAGSLIFRQAFRAPSARSAGGSGQPVRASRPACGRQWLGPAREKCRGDIHIHPCGQPERPRGRGGVPDEALRSDRLVFLTANGPACP